MAEAGEKRDAAREELDNLADKLLACAMNLFAGRGCHTPDAVLPGTAKSAQELVWDTICILLVTGYWIPGSGEDPFPRGYIILKRDFLDLVRSAEFKSTEIRNVRDKEDRRLTAWREDSHSASGELWLHSMRPHLADDAEAIKLLECVLVKGLETAADLAAEMGITEQDVNNIKKRLRSKHDKWRHLFKDDEDNKDV